MALFNNDDDDDGNRFWKILLLMWIFGLFDRHD